MICSAQESAQVQEAQKAPKKAKELVRVKLWAAVRAAD
jgi:hypothetical protein